MYGLIIIGGGPAGMTAAVYAARKRLNALLISRDVGGQVLWTHGIENYMGYQYIEGRELMQKFEEQVEEFPLEQRIGEGVTSLSVIDGGYEVATDKDERLQSKAVIVSSGKRPRQLNVPGEERLKGRGVSYCAVSDSPVFPGEHVAVIGGGNSALEAAHDMIVIGEFVYLVSVHKLTGDEILVDSVKNATNVDIYLEHDVVEIEGSKCVEGIRIRNSKTGEERRLKVAGVFVEIGLVPNSEIVQGVARLNERGEIMVNPACETGVPGLFAAGDVTDVPEKQIVIAAGEGAKASLAAHRYLQRI